MKFNNETLKEAVIQQPEWIKDINNSPYILPTIGVLVIIFLVYKFLRNVYKFKAEGKKKFSKSKKPAGNEDNDWVEVVNMRVKAMPMNTIKRLGITIHSYGYEHFNEYKANEHRIPKENREEVALNRVQGFRSIRDYIQKKGTKAQKFHLDSSIMGAVLYESYLKGEYKNNKAEKYEIDNNLPAKETHFGQELFKRDVTGLKAYFKERKNMERLFNELTWAIRNGHSVQKYLIDGNLMDDKEIRMVAKTGFNDIASFLKDMLKLNENAEMRKDYNACLEAVKILS
tara:strand:- start:5239 stop:6093 length:855 start_codon:yes stop_codon:yes gene_type:complete